MSERSSKRGGPDRKNVPGHDGCQVEDLVKRHGISNDQASRLIRQTGPDRAELDAKAEQLVKREPESR